MNRKGLGKHHDQREHQGKFPLVPDLRPEKRSLDMGESGQFASGGYYNQQGAIAPGRSHLDDLVPDEDMEKE